jgi:hypothetical protein
VRPFLWEAIKYAVDDDERSAAIIVGALELKSFLRDKNIPTHNFNEEIETVTKKLNKNKKSASSAIYFFEESSMSAVTCKDDVNTCQLCSFCQLPNTNHVKVVDATKQLYQAAKILNSIQGQGENELLTRDKFIDVLVNIKTKKTNDLSINKIIQNVPSNIIAEWEPGPISNKALRELLIEGLIYHSIATEIIWLEPKVDGGTTERKMRLLRFLSLEGSTTSETVFYVTK